MLRALSGRLHLRWPLKASNRVANYSAPAEKASEWVYHSDTGIVSRKDEGGSATPLFQSVIGMEIHAQLSIPTKLFSSAPTSHNEKFDSAPNSAIWPLDVAVPGVLPRVSRDAIHAAVITAASCSCHIPPVSRFERKHYTYADLPLGYQVTQQRWPLATNGKLTCRRKRVESVQKNEPRRKGGKRRRGQRAKENEQQPVQKNHEESETIHEQSKYFTVGIDRIQLEQDTGKTTTATRKEVNNNGNEVTVTESLVDFNRAGCALVEIVFCPDMRSASEAASVVSTLRDLLRFVGTCDGKMEEGSLRCDLNLSIAPIDCETNHNLDDDNPFQDFLPPGTGHRVEVKNLNSIRQVAAAAEYEVLRQAKASVSGSPTERETRTFNVQTGETVTIRSKEGAVDYRFMPEPDLPPIVLNEEAFDGKTLDGFLEESLPELPEEATSRLMKQFGIAEDVALVITSDKPAISMYEEAVKTAKSKINELADKLAHEQHHNIPVMTANWLTNDLFALVRDSATSNVTIDEEGHTELNHPVSVEYSTVNGNQLGLLIAMIVDGTVSTTMAKKILSILYHDEPANTDPRQVADARGWKVISDPEELRQLCKDVILSQDHESQLSQYRKGGKHVTKMEKFFIGQAMKASRGNAHPERLKEALRTVLEQTSQDERDPE